MTETIIPIQHNFPPNPQKKVLEHSFMKVTGRPLPPSIPSPATQVSEAYRDLPTSRLILKQSTIPKLQPTRQSTRSIQPTPQPTGLIGAVTSVIRSVSSSNQSHLKTSLVMKSRFARVMEVISHFIRDNWFVIRPIFITIAIIIGVLLIGPVALGFLA